MEKLHCNIDNTPHNTHCTSCCCHRCILYFVFCVFLTNLPQRRWHYLWFIFCLATCLTTLIARAAATVIIDTRVLDIGIIPEIACSALGARSTYSWWPKLELLHCPSISAEGLSWSIYIERFSNEFCKLIFMRVNEGCSLLKPWVVRIDMFTCIHRIWR